MADQTWFELHAGLSNDNPKSGTVKELQKQPTVTKITSPSEYCGNMKHTGYLGRFGSPAYYNEGHNTMRRNKGGSYDVYSEGGRRMGKGMSKARAHKRIAEIEYFKKHKG